MPKLSNTQRAVLKLMEQGYQIAKSTTTPYTVIRLAGVPTSEIRIYRATLDFLAQNGLVVRILDTGTLEIYGNCEAGHEALSE